MNSPRVPTYGLIFSSILLSAGLVAGQSKPAQPAQPAKTGVVTGRLLSKDGTPAAGIRLSAVEALDPGGPLVTPAIVSSAMTNNSGEYKVDDIPPGRYFITSGLVDLPTYYPGVSDVSGATVVRITAGATVSGVDFAMAIGVGFQVSGRVILPPIAPIPNLQMIILLPFTPTSSLIQQSVVKADGSFEFSRVRPGRYNLLTPLIPSSIPFSQQAAVVTVLDKDVTGIELVPPFLVNVSGRVTLQGNESAPNPAFSLSFAGATRGTANVLTDGTFRTSLPAGEYRVAASALPAGYYLKSIVADSADLSQALLTVSGPASAEVVVTISVQSTEDGLPK